MNLSQWFPPLVSKTFKRLGGKGPNKTCFVYQMSLFREISTLVFIAMKLGMPSPDQWHKDQMTLEQTLHREGHAVTPMNVQLAMAIRSLASAMVVWWLFGCLATTLFYDGRMFQKISDLFRCYTYFLVISCHIRVLSFPEHIAYGKSMKIMQR